MNLLSWRSICPGGEALHIASVKYSTRLRPELHDQDFYECFLVESGTGLHWTPEAEEPLRSGDLIFIRPEHAHGFSGSPSHPLVFTNIAFEQSVAETLMPFCHPLNKYWRPKGAAVHRQLTHRQREEMLSLVLEVAHSSRNPADAAFCLSGIARILRPALNENQYEQLPGWLQGSLPIAKEPDNLRQGTTKLVQLCGRSPEHVSRCFRKYLNLSPSEWINGERIRYACRLLQTTQQSVLEIALDCGFESHSYFHSRFKKQVGQTPMQFRRHVSRVQNTPEEQ